MEAEAQPKAMILIVDDNPQNLKIIATLLERNNYDTALAMNGKEALEFLGRENPDLVLLDVMMPEMDGYEVCRIIKKDKRTTQIPVIFLTARFESEDIVAGFEAGGVDYISKPYNSTELLARVKTHVELKQAREEIKTLLGFIPVCSHCRQVRDDKGFWQAVEVYIERHTGARVSHSICGKCAKELYPESKSAQNMDYKNI